MFVLLSGIKSTNPDMLTKQILTFKQGDAPCQLGWQRIQQTENTRQALFICQREDSVKQDEYIICSSSQIPCLILFSNQKNRNMFLKKKYGRHWLSRMRILAPIQRQPQKHKGWKYYVLCVMCHVSCVMSHMLCVMWHMPCVMCHVSCVIWYVSHVSHVNNANSHI